MLGGGGVGDCDGGGGGYCDIGGSGGGGGDGGGSDVDGSDDDGSGRPPQTKCLIRSWPASCTIHNNLRPIQNRTGRLCWLGEKYNSKWKMPSQMEV